MTPQILAVHIAFILLFLGFIGFFVAMIFYAYKSGDIEEFYTDLLKFFFLRKT
jgi:hypothetical protein